MGTRRGLLWSPFFMPKHPGSHHVEFISTDRCLDCGHQITDHKAHGKWTEPKFYGKHNYCIGARGTCPCRDFKQPHTSGKPMVGFGRAG